jgi:hypothetical protein
MNTHKIAAITVLTLAGGAAQAATLGTAATAYALGNEGTSLVTVATELDGAPSAVTLVFAGQAPVSLDAIAYRPRTTQLYGYDDATATVYEINPKTGAATAVATNPGVTTDEDVGFDFNNVLDAARIVTGEDENIVFFPNNMPPTLEPKTPLFYVPGDVNEGRNPNVVMNAYTNAVPMPATTQQYVIDSDWNILATLGNNAGTLETVGALYFDGLLFDVTEDGGFDILSFAEGDNTAYALLTSSGSQGIYEVPLMADAMGRINLSFVTAATRDFGRLDGFAVAPSAVPVPASLGLLAAALGGIAALGRARRKA